MNLDFENVLSCRISSVEGDDIGEVDRSSVDFDEDGILEMDGRDDLRPLANAGIRIAF